jgi:hypothetical protein
MVRSSPQVRIWCSEENIGVLISRPDDTVVLFSRQASGAEDSEFANQFSVSTPGHKQISGRSIVTHCGGDSGSGIWKCSKDGVDGCIHIRKARDHLRKLITSDPLATANDRGEGDSDENSREAFAPGMNRAVNRGCFLG